MNASITITALVLSFLLHFGIQKVFIRFKKFDNFNHRSSHKTLATRTGGIGVFATLFFISLFFYFQNIDLFDYSLFIPLGIMFIVGVYDDFYNADFKLKFLLQIIVAKILIDQGYLITNYHGLFGLYEVPWMLAQLSTVFVFLVVVNAVNFIDGIDGLAITEVIKAILLIEFFSEGFSDLAPMGFLLISSMLPLYYFNFKKKRKVFIGDGGSMLLGSAVAVYLFYVLGNQYHFNPQWTMNKTLFAVLVVLYPLVDLLRVIVIRIKNGNSPFQPDQNHLHHKVNSYLKNPFFSVTLITFVSLFILCAVLYLNSLGG
jgi:UDP-N-acetylmuramyl pentapeptide phosphotransferase/UDP-N-acetylglucosamine-1-phosphate transferase